MVIRKRSAVIFGLTQTQFNDLCYYLAGVLISVFLFFWILMGFDFDFRNPVIYDGDAFHTFMQFKVAASASWWPYRLLSTHIAGAPFGYVIGDYPIADQFHLIAIKLLSFFTKDPVALFNIYYFINFPLSTLTFMFVAKKLRIHGSLRVVLGVLFAFLPYHLRRFCHLFLGAYSFLPFFLLVLFWVWSAKPLFFRRDRETGRVCLDYRSRKAQMSALVAFVGATVGVYYAFFFGFFVAIAGFSAAFYRRSFKNGRYHLLSAGLLLLILGGSLGMTGFANLWYWHKHGRNHIVGVRTPYEAEVYSLKLIQIVWPQSNHRNEEMRTIRRNYQSASPIAEGYDEAVGWVSLLGFAILFLRLLVLGRKSSTLDKLSLFLVTGFMLGTFGGLGEIFAKVVSPMFRCYNRISVFLALFALMGLAYALQSLRRRIGNGGLVLASLILLPIGIYDQITPDYNGMQKGVIGDYRSDQEFFRAIEAQMPAESQILQLPYLPFPEQPPVLQMSDYSHFRAPILSNHLRWSYGVMHGRPGDAEIRAVSQFPLNLGAIRTRGYTGIYIDRFAYADRAAAIEKTLAEQLKTPPLVSHNQRLSFFSLLPVLAK